MQAIAQYAAAEEAVWVKDSVLLPERFGFRKEKPCTFGSRRISFYWKLGVLQRHIHFQSLYAGREARCSTPESVTPWAARVRFF